MDFIKKIKQFFEKNRTSNGEENSLKYKDLAPDSNIANGNEYFEELKWALNNTKISNIALSGPYGAGKSSVIESFFAQNKEHKPLIISLAAFKGNKDCINEPGEGSNSGKEHFMESEEIAKGFLQQLFYRVDYKRIPQSRYRKLHRVKTSKIFWNLLAISLLILLSLCVINNDICSIIFYRMKNWGSAYNINSTVNFILSIILFMIIMGVISNAVKWTYTHIGNAEISIANKAKFTTDKANAETIFNKYLDEIVYFFEETDYDVVILEDIDRYENTEIFVKLRELNRLLNSYESIDRHIVFIYAMKDDFFKNSTERTKFFDFIVSVIPFINATNSDNLLRRRIDEIKKTGIEISIEDEFITKVAPFISDMRVLTSIFNDFVLYKNTLNVDKELNLSDEQMLSLMIYKNLNPQDFAAIESEQGIIKDSFKAKKKLIEQKTFEKEEKLNLLKGRIEGAIKDSVNSVEEFKILLLFNLSKRSGVVTNIQINGKVYKFAEIMSEDFDMNLLCGTPLVVSFFNATTNSNSTNNVDNIDDYSYDSMSVIERWESLKLLDREKKARAQEEIEELRDEIYQLKSLKIKDMISSFGTEFLSADDDFANKNKLLIFFLRNGYIDENYVNYINYFHPDSITVDEQRYILNIRNYGGIQDFEQNIVHKKRVVDRLVVHEFRQEEVLNFSLVEYLFSSEDDKDKQSELQILLASRSDNVKEFIQRYLQKFDENAKAFIEKISKSNLFLCEDLLSDETIPEDTKIHYFDMIISYSDLDSLLVMNEESSRSIAKFIEEQSDIFEKLELCPIERLLDLIHSLNIKIDSIKCRNVDNRIIELIYKESKYDLNTTMLLQYVEWRSPELLEMYTHSNYSTLRSINDQEVLSYIDDNIDTYIEKVFFSNENNCETESAIIEICEKYNFDDTAIRIVDSQTTIFKDIQILLDAVEDKGVVQTLIDHIIETKKFDVSWDNYYKYYICYGMTEFIFNRIQNDIEALIYSDEELDDELISELVQCNWIHEKFVQFIKKYKMKKFEVSISAIPKDSIISMIDENYIPFSVNIYDEINDEYKDCRLSYILNHYDEFFEIIEEIELEKIPLDELMESQKVRIEEKIMMIQFVPEDQITIKMAQVLRGTNITIEKKYIIAAWNCLEKNDKYQLLLNHIEVFDNSELPSLFKQLDYMYQDLAKRSSRHKVSLYCNEYNESLLKKLEKKRYVSSIGYEEKEKTEFTPIPKKIKERYVYGWVRAVKNA